MAARATNKMGCNLYAGRKFPILFSEHGCQGEAIEVTHPNSDFHDFPADFVARSVYVPEGYSMPEKLAPLLRDGELPMVAIGHVRFNYTRPNPTKNITEAVVISIVVIGIASVLIFVWVQKIKK